MPSLHVNENTWTAFYFTIIYIYKILNVFARKKICITKYKLEIIFFMNTIVNS